MVALKLLELTRFLSPNRSIFNYLLKFCTVLGVRCDVDIFNVTASIVVHLNRSLRMNKNNDDDNNNNNNSYNSFIEAF